MAKRALALLFVSFLLTACGGEDASPPERHDGRLRIYTTFDLAAQADALPARDENLPENDKGFELAIVSVETHTGAVRAMVAGPDFQREKFNLATDGIGRQAGSSMKTFSTLFRRS